MPDLVNFTPFPNFRYYSRDNKNDLFGAIIVKGTLELDPFGRLVVAEEQAPFVFTDRCHGAVNVSSLWHPSDLVPKKPATDVIVNAVARAVGAVASPSWRCGVSVNAGGSVLLDKHLTVMGPRSWVPHWKRTLSEEQAKDWQRHRDAFAGWTLSEPEPVTEVALHYENSFGGEIKTGVGEDGEPIFDTDQRNPLGKGRIHKEWTDHTKSVTAAQIEDPADPINDPYHVYRPENLAPIPPAWLPRRPLGGTYDKNWVDNIWPAWPADYSFAYHNSAQSDLQVHPFLNGSETVVLTGLSFESDPVKLRLPGVSPQVDLITADKDTYRARMTLDTVFIDIAAPHRKDWRVFLSWRVSFEPNRFKVAVIHQIEEGHPALEKDQKVQSEKEIAL